MKPQPKFFHSDYEILRGCPRSFALTGGGEGTFYALPYNKAMYFFELFRNEYENVELAECLIGEWASFEDLKEIIIDYCPVKYEQGIATFKRKNWIELYNSLQNNPICDLTVTPPVSPQETLALIIEQNNFISLFEALFLQNNQRAIKPTYSRMFQAAQIIQLGLIPNLKLADIYDTLTLEQYNFYLDLVSQFEKKQIENQYWATKIAIGAAFGSDDKRKFDIADVLFPGNN